MTDTTSNSQQTNGRTIKPTSTDESSIGMEHSSPFISERPIDEPRPLKVIYIGAGISGITGAILFRKAVPDLDLVIYEKNTELGGTWYENRYPGCACDVPSHSYQLSFESWTNWSSFYSSGPEILEYWKLVAAKHDVRKHIRFNCRCVEARWNDRTSRWFVRIQEENSGESFEDSGDVLMTGTGILNEWVWPNIEGLQTFQGALLHSADWDEKFDPEGKTLAVIGGGSSGIQIVPALVDKVAAIDHYIRGRMWITTQHGKEQLARRAGPGAANFHYTEEEKQAWRDNPESYVKYRKGLEYDLQSWYGVSQRGHAAQIAAQATIKAYMHRKLEKRPELMEKLLPDFPPLCKRITPGPGYLEALTQSKVTTISNAITHVDATGITTVDRIHRPVDAIICATGFQTKPSNGFPILGRDGVNLREKYAHRPETYLSLCTNGFPNFFQSLGPYSFQGAGSLLIMMESIHMYVSKVLRKMAYGNVGTIEPKRRQVCNFTNLAERYFDRTVYSTECSSWYKTSPVGASVEERKKGRVTALWPGSSVHAIKALSEVRLEDFETTPHDGNEFGWFGNGWTVGERGSVVDEEAVTWYLNGTEFVNDVFENTRL